MTAVQTAKGVLADAEKSLRELMQQELKAHRYSELAELAGLANSLAKLAGDTGNGAAPKPAAKASPRPVARPATKNKAKPKNAYPRFERDGEKLIKIGWSKKAREEYEHRAPRLAVLAFAEHIGRVTFKGKKFLVEDLLPVCDAIGEEIPSYQVYLTLAWLRQIGVVEKNGRDGYVRIADPLDGSVFDTLWDELPLRS